MAASLGDLLQVNARGGIDGVDQTCLNVYYYRVTSITGLGGTYLDDILEWFEDSVLDVIRTAQSNEFLWAALEAYNLSNGIDFATLALPATSDSRGTVTGESLPTFVTYGWQLLRESLVTRNGYKRFSGVPESAGSENDYAPSVQIQTDISGVLAADIVLGAITVAEPIIVHRPVGVPPVSSYTYSSVGSARFRGIGTQNTRKVGRGA